MIRYLDSQRYGTHHYLLRVKDLSPKFSGRGYGGCAVVSVLAQVGQRSTVGLALRIGEGFDIPCTDGGSSFRRLFRDKVRRSDTTNLAPAVTVRCVFTYQEYDGNDNPCHGARISDHLGVGFFVIDARASHLQKLQVSPVH